MAGAARAYNRIYYGFQVVMLGAECASGLVHQLLYYICVVLGQGLAHLGAGVARSHAGKYGNHAYQCNLVPFVQVIVIGLDGTQFGLGVAYQGAQGALVVGTEFIAENRLNLLLYHARCRAQHVVKRVVLAVDIGHKMLGTLGQVEDCLQVYDLGRCRRDAWKALGQQLQIFYASLHSPDLFTANLAKTTQRGRLTLRRFLTNDAKRNDPFASFGTK